MSCEDEYMPCQLGQLCDNKGEDEFYNIYFQFKNVNINFLDNDNLVELLKIIKDPEIRLQIIDKMEQSKPYIMFN